MKRRKCRLCEKEFVPPREMPNKRYCSEAHYRMGRAGQRPCRTCDQPFTPVPKQQRYCSDPCRAKGHSRVNMESMRRAEAAPSKPAPVKRLRREECPPGRYMETCSECEATFFVYVMQEGRPRLTCSPECSADRNRRLSRERARRKVSG